MRFIQIFFKITKNHLHLFKLIQYIKISLKITKKIIHPKDSITSSKLLNKSEITTPYKIKHGLKESISIQITLKKNSNNSLQFKTHRTVQPQTKYPLKVMVIYQKSGIGEIIMEFLLLKIKVIADHVGPFQLLVPWKLIIWFFIKKNSILQNNNWLIVLRPLIIMDVMEVFHHMPLNTFTITELQQKKNILIMLKTENVPIILKWQMDSFYMVVII